MELLKLLKADLYKSICRRNTILLFVPCLIPLLFCIFAKMNVLTLSSGENVKEQLSCMEFTNVCWRLVSGIYIINILALLLGTFHFSSELDGGQIKNYLLRSGHRYHVIISKLMSLALQFLAMIVSFIVVSILSYYIFLVSTSYASREFIKYDIFNTYSFWLYMTASFLRMVVLAALSFFLGLKLKPFSCFIIVFFISLAVRYSGAIKVIPIYKLSPDYLLSRIDSIRTPDFAAWISIIVLILYVVLFTGAAVFGFQKQDIK